LQVMAGGQTTVFGGPMTVGNIAGGITSQGDIIPRVMNTANLGAVNKEWSNVYTLNVVLRDGGGTDRNALSARTKNVLQIGSQFNNVAIDALKTTGNAGGKQVVCVDTTTGQLYASSTATDCSN